MKEINLLSVVQAYNNTDESLLQKYFKYFDISPKMEELKDLDSLIRFIQKENNSIELLDKFFFGYTIPQISKEFDLLRFGDNYIINIELKRTSTKEKIVKQLKRNRYYLSFLNLNVLSFTFVASEKKIYRLDNNENLIEESFEELSKVISNQKVKQIIDVNQLFNPSNYLVSPFNSTDKFIAKEYFLTSQQEEIKNNTLKAIKKNSNASFVSISGKAGTGKTLLTYDIAQECISEKLNVLIVHCGLLNDGHRRLRDEYNWDITPIKNIHNKVLSNYSLIILDEAQRIYPNQLDFIIQEVSKHNKVCVFSYDMQQCLHRSEIVNNIEEHIESKTKAIKYQLTEKIRTNKEIASFIHAILNKTREVNKLNRSNIDLQYFKEYKSAKNYITLLKKNNWKVINFTPSRKHTHPYENYSIAMEDNTHGIIGQEFDKVVAVVDSHFFYNSNNRLSTRGYKDTPYYHPTKMLLQVMTRTRKKLSFIVINNNEIMNRCLEILN